MFSRVMRQVWVARMTRAADFAIPRTPVKRIRRFDPRTFLAQAGLGRTVVDLKKKQIVFSQGDAAESIFYIQRGKIKLTVISKSGKEATIALLGEGEFFRGGMHRWLATAAHGDRGGNYREYGA
jgi:CRP-like cAMP-binding protein